MQYFPMARIAVLTGAAFLAACNSGGSSSSGAASTPGAPTVDARQGQFIDAPVSGISYSTDGGVTHQLTDAEGFFEYQDGDIVYFSLGGIEFGSASGADILQPIDLQQDSAQAASNMARVLLTLDRDGAPANGIQISDIVRQRAQSLSLPATAFDISPEDLPASALADFARSANQDGERTLRSVADAAAEQHCTEQDLQDGQYDGDCERGLPVVDAGTEQSAQEGGELFLTGSATAAGDRSVQRMIWRQTSGPSAAIQGAVDQNQLHIVLPQVNGDSILEFRLTAVDSAGLTGTDSVLVSVTDILPNRVPAVDAGNEQTVTSRDSVVLSGAAEDADGDIVATAWRVLSQSPAVSLRKIDNNSVSFTAPNVADTTTLSFEFSATDNEDATAADVVQVVVQPSPDNQVPSIDSILADPGVASVGEQVGLLSSASDADDDPLSYIWKQVAPAEPLLHITDAVLNDAATEMPELEQDTSFEFELAVSDGATSVVRNLQLLGVPPSAQKPSPEECLSNPTQWGCPLWTYRDMLSLEDFANCNPDPSVESCPFSVLVDADPGLLSCLTLRTEAACAGIAENLFDPSYLTEKIPPDQAVTSCNPAYDAATYEHYIGAWHEHTGYSDGTWGQRPIDMMEQVKARGFDWAGSSEHSDTLDPGNPAALPRDCPLPPQIGDIGVDPRCLVGDQEQLENNVRKWAAIKEMVDAVTDDSFTGLRGFEWTSDRFGHINVFFSEHVINAKTEAGYAVSMTRFWQWFTYPSTFGGGDDAILSFNHPGREDTIEGFLHEDVQGNLEDNLAELPKDLHDPTYTFNDFRFVPGADYRAVALEVFGKGSEYDSGGRGGSWLSYALDKGWHLGPMGSEDHHGTDWGAGSLPKTVAIARSRDANDLREALLARRFYAVAQHYNDIRISYTVDGQPMGARIRAPEGTQLNATVSISRGGIPFSAEVEFVTAGNTIAESLTGADVATTLRVGAGESYYFLRIRDPKTNRPIAFAAPVWLIAGESALPACPVDGGVPQ